jgi:hypothetical protein
LSSNGEVYNDHEIVDGVDGLMGFCTKSTGMKKTSRAKAQSGAAFLRVFFAPLREK